MLIKDHAIISFIKKNLGKISEIKMDSLGPIQNRLQFIEFLVAVVVGWLLVQLWVPVIENLAYGTLNLNKTSTLQTFVVAFVVSSIFIFFLFLLRPSTLSELQTSFGGGSRNREGYTGQELRSRVVD
jgi:hypothetical protein